MNEYQITFESSYADACSHMQLAKRSNTGAMDLADNWGVDDAENKVRSARDGGSNTK